MSIKTIGLSISLGFLSAGANLALGKSINKINLVGQSLDKLKSRRLDLQSKFSGATSSAKRLLDELKKIDKQIKAINHHKNRIQENIQARANLKSNIMDKVAIGASIALPFKTGIEFENSMARVKALFGATKEEFESLNITAKKLGASTTFGASEVAQGMSFLSMAGFKANDTVKAMSGLLNLASAGATDLATTSDIASNILSGFSLEASQMTRVADVLAKTMTSSNVNCLMLGDTMKYVAPVASSVGASIEEVAALSGKLGDVGIQGSQAGTTLKAMYARLSAPPSEARKMLEELGISTTDASGNFKGMLPLIGELNEATKDLGDASKMEALRHIFGLESLGGAVALLNTGQVALSKYKESLEQSTGIASKIAFEQNNNVAGSFKALSSAIEALSISFSSLFLPALKTLVLGITSLTQGLNSFVSKNKTLSAVLGGVILGFGSFIVIGSVVAYVFTFVSNAWHKSALLLRLLSVNLNIAAIKTKALGLWTGILGLKSKITAAAMGILRTAQIGLNIAMAANPIGLIVVGLSTLVTALVWAYNKFDWFRNGVNGLWSGIKSIFKGSLNFISNVFSAPIRIIKNIWGSLFDWLGAKFEWISKGVSWVKKAGQKISGVFGSKEIASDTKLKKMEPIDKASLNAPQSINHNAMQGTNNITINVNNPKSDIDIERAVKKALSDIQTDKFNRSF